MALPLYSHREREGMKKKDINRVVAQRIRELRKARRWSQEELAGRTNLSVHTIGAIERGRSSPTVDTLFRITQALGVELSEFFDPTIPEIGRYDKERRELWAQLKGKKPDEIRAVSQLAQVLFEALKAKGES